MTHAERNYIVDAGTGAAFVVERGKRFRVRNTYGTQVVDTWAFARERQLGEHMSMEHTRVGTKHLGVKPGMKLLTNERRPILSVTNDTSSGIHDTLIAACDVHRYHGLGHKDYHRNCQDNLRAALAEYGEPSSIPCPLNLFMNIKVGNAGELIWLEPNNKPGDFVEFQAEMDCIVVLSACPMDLVPINGAQCVPRDVEAEILR